MYQFPQPKELKLTLKDLLEDEVDEKYFVSQNMLNYLTDMSGNGNFVRGERFKPIDLDVDKIGNTIHTRPGSMVIDNWILIKNNTAKGYLKAVEGDGIDLSYPNSTTRRGRVQKGMSQTLTTDDTKAVVVLYKGLRLRKLTPLECWRLMGFTDEQFYKAEQVNSNTQLYKQAGNSIVVDVLVALLKPLYEEWCVDDFLYSCQ